VNKVIARLAGTMAVTLYQVFWVISYKSGMNLGSCLSSYYSSLLHQSNETGTRQTGIFRLPCFSSCGKKESIHGMVDVPVVCCFSRIIYRFCPTL